MKDCLDIFLVSDINDFYWPMESQYEYEPFVKFTSFSGNAMFKYIFIKYNMCGNMSLEQICPFFMDSIFSILDDSPFLSILYIIFYIFSIYTLQLSSSKFLMKCFSVSYFKIANVALLYSLSDDKYDIIKKKLEILKSVKLK